MAKTVKITTDNQISLVDIMPFDQYGWYRAIGGGCDCVETVRTQWMFDLFQRPVMMLVDEEGRIRGRERNLSASLLYGMMEHGEPIVGNVLFAIPAEPEILPPADAGSILETLKRVFPFLKEDKQE